MFLQYMFPVYTIVCLAMLLQSWADMANPAAIILAGTTCLVLSTQGLLTYRPSLDRVTSLPIVLLATMVGGVWTKGITILLSTLGVYTALLLLLDDGASRPSISTDSHTEELPKEEKFTKSSDLIRYLRNELFTRSRFPGVALHAALVLGNTEWIEEAIAEAREKGQHLCIRQEMDKVLTSPIVLQRKLVPILVRADVRASPETLLKLIPTLDENILDRIVSVNYGTEVTVLLCRTRPSVAEYVASCATDKSYALALLVGLNRTEAAKKTLAEEPKLAACPEWISTALSVAEEMKNQDMIEILKSTPEPEVEVKPEPVTEGPAKKSWWGF